MGCSHNVDAAAHAQPLEVQVAPVQQKDVPVYQEWIGTLDGLVNADIKAEVSGYLIDQVYKEGSFVSKGQLLFQIDPRPFQAVPGPKPKASSRSRKGRQNRRACS